MSEEIVITVNIPQMGLREDLEVPGEITAIDLIEALANIYGLKIDRGRIYDYYLKMDHPKALLRGNQTLAESGMREGSEVWLWNEE